MTLKIFRLLLESICLALLIPRPVQASNHRVLNVDATSMRLSLNGSSLLWSNKTRTLWIDVPTGRVLSSFSLGDGSKVRMLGLSPDGQLALVERKGVGVELWKRKQTMVVRQWNWNRAGEISAALILSDRIMFLAASTVWTLDFSRHLMTRRKLPCFGSEHDVFSPDGHFLWADSYLYNLKTGQRVLSLWEEQFIYDVRFSPSGHLILLSAIGPTNESESWVFDTRNRREFKALRNELWFDCVWAPDDTLSRTSLNYPLHFKNVRTAKSSRFKPPLPWRKHSKSWLASVQFSHDGQVMAALAKSGRIWIETSDGSWKS